MTCGPTLWQTQIKHLKASQPTYLVGQLLCFQQILGISSQSQVYGWNSPITCHSPSIWMIKMVLVSLFDIFPKLNFQKHLCSYFESVHLDLFPWKWKSLSHVWLFATPYSPWSSPGQNTGVGSHSLFQGIFPIQGSNPGLLHYKWILLLSEPPG